MNNRIFIYPAIVASLFIHPILTVAIVLCGCFLISNFYEGLAIVLAIDIWFAGGISYATIAVCICLCALYFARPYIRI